MGWAGLGAIVWSVFVFGAATPFPGTAALLPVAGTMALLVAGTRPAQTHAPGSASRLLGRPPLVRIGRISYAWYLWHWPVLVLVPAWLGHALPLWARLGLAALSGVLAAATVVLVEDPIRSWPRLVTTPRRVL